jgi:5-(carboxyamino)imidazole ribonucleotide synthase
MTNLIGAEVLEVDTLSKDTSIGIHLYGKEIVKPGRKMGHINKILANN